MARKKKEEEKVVEDKVTIESVKATTESITVTHSDGTQDKYGIIHEGNKRYIGRI